MAFQAILHPPNWLKTEWYNALFTPTFHAAGAGSAAAAAPSPGPSQQLPAPITDSHAMRLILYMITNTATFGTALTLVALLLRMRGWDASSARSATAVTGLAVIISVLSQNFDPFPDPAPDPFSSAPYPTSPSLPPTLPPSTARTSSATAPPPTPRRRPSSPPPSAVTDSPPSATASPPPNAPPAVGVFFILLLPLLLIPFAFSSPSGAQRQGSSPAVAAGSSFGRGPAVSLGCSIESASPLLTTPAAVLPSSPRWMESRARMAGGCAVVRKKQSLNSSPAVLAFPSPRAGGRHAPPTPRRKSRDFSLPPPPLPSSGREDPRRPDEPSAASSSDSAGFLASCWSRSPYVCNPRPMAAKTRPARARQRPAPAKTWPARAWLRPARARLLPARARLRPARTRLLPARAWLRPARVWV
ncbi:hypothetical protein HU200_020574 [Digitaria exilis]|uniref:Uncharacterized protein n=1 Tax=Digitaria exilis TaxID=1010633 RepID=A0A835F296_9POAL|nr:hypothetical protein HU200_020574 [Digitaria exilis]